MKTKLLAFVLGLLAASTAAVQAQTLQPYQTRCSAGTYVTCSYPLYSGTSQEGFASQNFNRGVSPQSEHDLYVQNPTSYQPAFTVSDLMDGNNLNYVPQDVRWSNAGQYVVLQYTTVGGWHANAVFNNYHQTYGCGRTRCTGTFWTIWDGTTFEK